MFDVPVRSVSIVDGGKSLEEQMLLQTALAPCLVCSLTRAGMYDLVSSRQVVK